MTGLPLPSEDALAHSQAMFAHLVGEIKKKGRLAVLCRLYGAGPLRSGTPRVLRCRSTKIRRGGDFVTAPEMTPLFAQALAPQVAEIMAASAPEIIEVGAGSGQLAADLLQALETLQALPEHYAILELSPDLQARQRETLAAQVPHLQDQVGTGCTGYLTNFPASSWPTNCSTRCQHIWSSGDPRRSANGVSASMRRDVSRGTTGRPVANCWRWQQKSHALTAYMTAICQKPARGAWLDRRLGRPFAQGGTVAVRLRFPGA